MSGRWKPFVAAVAVIGALLVVAAIVMGVVSIWSTDDRWGYTALLLGATGFVLLFGGATWPGWME